MLNFQKDSKFIKMILRDLSVYEQKLKRWDNSNLSSYYKK